VFVTGGQSGDHTGDAAAIGGATASATTVTTVTTVTTTSRATMAPESYSREPAALAVAP